MKKHLLCLLLMLSLLVYCVPVYANNTNPSKQITISFAGDCTLGGYLGQGTNANFESYFLSNGPDYFFANVKSVFENDNITCVNLEGPLTDYKQTVSKTYPMRGETKYVDILKGSSVEVCNLSNNHIYDCGQNGFKQTVELLSSNHIGMCGEGSMYLTEANGISVAFLGYQGWSCTDTLKEQIRKDIKFSSQADVICISFHWGVERSNISNTTQEELAHWAIDNGADVVIGHHPHVIQGVELYRGKPICYSLGNFSFGANKNPSDKDTFIFQSSFVRMGDGSVVLNKCEVIPCRISSVTSSNNYQPTLLDAEDKDAVISRLKNYSSKYPSSIF